jgi:hypothetical protein
MTVEKFQKLQINELNRFSLPSTSQDKLVPMNFKLNAGIH